MNKSPETLDIEIDQLKRRLTINPGEVIRQAELCLARARQQHSSEAIIESLLIMSRCCWHLSQPKLGFRYAKEALTEQNRLDADEQLPTILHLKALHSFGAGKYFTAQQYWINALEQAALEEDIIIEIKSLMGLGDIWRETQQYDIACSTHKLAVHVANNTRKDWLEGRARILWAWDLYLAKNYVEMLEVLDGAQELLEDYPEKKWLAELWDFRALALLGLERLEDAEEATQTALDLATTHNLTWLKVHSAINRARLELMLGNIDIATELLEMAESAMDQSSNHDDELLSQIYYQQSIIAEQRHQLQLAFNAFKKYRHHALELVRNQKLRESKDIARESKRQLEKRAKKLINRVKGLYEYNPERHLSNVVSETYWWEQLMMFKTELLHASHTVIVIHHDNPKYIDICMELAHSLCSSRDLVSRLHSNKLGLLLAEKDKEAFEMYKIIQQMLKLYPWQRQGLEETIPAIALHNILTFPFTLEQLDLLPRQGAY